MAGTRLIDIEPRWWHVLGPTLGVALAASAYGLWHDQSAGTTLLAALAAAGLVAAVVRLVLGRPTPRARSLAFALFFAATASERLAGGSSTAGAFLAAFTNTVVLWAFLSLWDRRRSRPPSTRGEARPTPDPGH